MNVNRITVVVAMFLIIAISGLNNVAAQYSVSTPYSKYGIGYMAYANNNALFSMGGIGYAYSKDNEINFLNPASFSAVENQSFVFNIGFNLNWRKISTDRNSSDAFLAGINNIAFAFPLFNRLKAAMTLQPVSDIQYIVTDTVFSVPNSVKVFDGNGGVNKFALGLAYNPIDNLSIGATVSYYFGNIYRSTTLDFLTTQRNSSGNYSDTTGFYSSRTESNYNVSSFAFDFGVQYFHRLNNGDKLGIGVNFQPKYDLSTDKQMMYYTFFRYGTSQYIKDTLSLEKGDANIKMPLRIGAGISYERPGKLFAEADFTYTKWSQFSFQDRYDNDELKDNMAVNLGAEYIPDEVSVSYYKKLSYRVGLNYDNGYICLKDERIDRFGISFGIALPIKKLGTKVNMNFEAGRMGTKADGLIKENYYRIGLSISAKDKWFVKRKYQ